MKPSLALQNLLRHPLLAELEFSFSARSVWCDEYQHLICFRGERLIYIQDLPWEQELVFQLIELDQLRTVDALQLAAQKYDPSSYRSKRASLAALITPSLIAAFSDQDKAGQFAFFSRVLQEEFPKKSWMMD